MKRPLAMIVLGSCLWASSAPAQTLPRGTVVDPVHCADDPAQTYALYLPSTYVPERTWSVLFAFHPAARGRLMAEKFKAAAEQYGYIVAASNNARNGPHAISAAAAQAMSEDVSRRFSVDLKRIYLTGMSGGARVALGIGLGNPNVAGVVASSAGFPDSQPRDKVTFAVFGTAGTEDFNYIEMRLMDRKLSSPHFLAVFDGGHTLPPDEIAGDALAWMELQAMQSGRRSRDAALIDRLLDARRSRIAATTVLADNVYLLRSLVSDFTGLIDVAAEARLLDELSRRSDVKQALKRDRDVDDAEWRMIGEMFELEAQLADEGRRVTALMTLRARLAALSRSAATEADTPERRQSRRLLRAMTAGAAGRVQDREYLAVLEQHRLPGR